MREGEHSADGAKAFIRANTQLLAPPLVPEIVLHLAEESLPIWRKTEEELGEMNVPPPFWAFAWAGGQALARFIFDHPETVCGHSVVDIGAGAGITSIAAVKCGASSVLAADIDYFSVAACRINAEANDVEFNITQDDLLEAEPPACKVLFMADVFYERELSDRIMAFAGKAATRGADVLVGDPQRSYFPRSRFDKVAEYHVPVTRELEDSEIKRAAVWRLRI